MKTRTLELLGLRGSAQGERSAAGNGVLPAVNVAAASITLTPAALDEAA
jgi:hypothetical protein